MTNQRRIDRWPYRDEYSGLVWPSDAFLSRRQQPWCWHVARWFLRTEVILFGVLLAVVAASVVGHVCWWPK
ncbi:hypothetical protein LCGC14_1571440 [marine sediment metagenome]|uniref:Uncharacterized protein n=1 Tax=marine sediment metagenome TaxID=412755 RepID=A0A0F9LK02_9ZZZZ